MDLYMKGFVLLEDGECTWETKARNVQRLGAQALLIATDEDTYIDGREFHHSDSKYDGNGRGVDIPTLLIDRDHGQRLIDIYDEDGDSDSEQTMLQAHISIHDKKIDKISYSLYYGSIIDFDRYDLDQLNFSQKSLMGSAFLIPRIFTFECLECPKEIQKKHCISEGRFCFYLDDPELAAHYPKITEKHLIYENLREKCIYEEVGNTPDKGDGHAFFNYLVQIQH